MPHLVLDNVIKNHDLHQGESNNIPAANQDQENEDTCKEPSATNTEESSANCCQRWLIKYRLELISYLFMFSWVMVQISSTTMILDKVCLVNYNYSAEICSNLDNYTDIKSMIEKTATNYQLGHTLLQTAPSILISCFVAPWSDQYGRKLPVLVAIIGMVLDTLGSVACAFFLHSKVEYYFIPAIFTGCFGGLITVLTCIYSYASDVTPEALRTLKYAFLEMALGLSQPVGIGAGGWIYKFYGYPAVFMISAAGLTLSFILIAFAIPETRGLENYDPLKTKIKNLFTLETLKEGFNAVVKQRPNQGRKQILLLIVCMCFITIATKSTGDVNYFFAHHQYSWDNTTYSTIITIYSVICVLLLIVVVPVMKYYRIGDAALGLSGTISLLLKYIGIGLAWKPAVYHIANILGSLSTCASLATRSRISKMVLKEDIGKIFSFVATAEALLPVLSTVVIAQIFTASLQIYPAMPYIVLALCLIVPIGVFVWLTRLPNSTGETTDTETNGEEYKSID